MLRCARNDGARGAVALAQHASQFADTPSHPRDLLRPSFASSRHPPMSEGAGKTGCRPGTHGPLCERWQQKSAQRHTGEAQHTAFPAQWFDGLCRVLPGERCTIAPVALPIADARARSGRHITTRLGAQTPGARTTRFCRTRTAPVVRAPLNRSRAKPALRLLARRCAPRPPPPRPRIVTIAKRPLSLGRDNLLIRHFRISVNRNLFWEDS